MSHAYLTISYPASSLPVTLAELKSHLRIGLSVEDDVLTLFLGAACDRLTAETGYTPISTQYTYTLDLPEDLTVHLPRWPVDEILLVEVDGEPLDSYTLDAGGRTLTLPDDTTGDTVSVTFTAQDGSTIRAAKVAILMLAAHWYGNREAYAAGSELRSVPHGWDRITQSLRGAFPFREQK